MSDEAQEPLTPQAALDQKNMKLALEQAELAAQIGEVPIGAVVVFERPFETRNVGRAQPEFTLAFHKEYTIFELFGHEPLDEQRDGG